MYKKINFKHYCYIDVEPINISNKFNGISLLRIRKIYLAEFPKCILKARNCIMCNSHTDATSDCSRH